MKYWGRFAMVLGLAAGLSCRAEPEPRAVAEVPQEVRGPLAEIAFAGCERVLRGPLCEFAVGSALELWAPVTFDELELSVSGRALPLEDRVAADGYQVTLPIPAAGGELLVRQHGRIAVRLALVPSPPDAALTDVKRARDAGDTARALGGIAAIKANGSPLSRALAEGVEARIYLRMGRLVEASELLERTTAQLFELGQISEGTRDLFARLYLMLHRQHQLDEAEAWFLQYSAQAESYPLGRVLVREHEGMLRAAGGRISEALAAYALAERGFERLGQKIDVRRVQTNRIGLLSDLGQIAEAHELHARLLPPPEDEHACTKAEIYIKQSWLTMLRAEDGDQPPARDIAEHFRQAEHWLQKCGDPELRATQLINRGLWALELGDLAQSRAHAGELRELPGRSPYLEAWTLDLQGRLKLAEKRAGAARLEFEREHQLGLDTASPDASLRALCGLAEVAQAQGRTALAAQHLDAALAILDQAQQLAPLGQLGHSHYAARRQAAQRLVELLASQGKAEQAYRVALRAYGSALSSRARSRTAKQLDTAAERRIRESLAQYRQRRAELDAELASEWQLTSRERKVRRAARTAQLAELNRLLEETSRSVAAPSDERRLPSPAAGEYWLLWFPTRDGWLAFGNAGNAVKMAELPAAAEKMTDSSTHPALQPFESELRGAQSIVILAAGAARHWPFEQWLLAGTPLAQRQLAYSAALGPAPLDEAHAAAAAARAAKPAAIVDPRGDLPFARREGDIVAEALRLEPARLLQAEHATPSAVLALFETADHLHFAGHARGPDEPGGAALLLARGAAVEAWEFFGLRQVPRQVVLSACSSGLTDRSSFGGGWNLAQALIGAGAEWVIGPSGAIADEAALSMQQRLYRELATGTPLPDAFWKTSREHQQPHGAAVFRLFRR